MRTLAFRPVSEALGVELTGVDLREPIDDGLARAMRDALDRNHLILVRDQAIDDEDQLRVARVFGPLSQQGVAERKNFGDVGFISNVHPQKRGGLGELVFHSDQAAFERPESVLLLYGMVIPQSGGDTRFSSLTRAYRELPAALKERIAPLNGVHAFDYDAYFAGSLSRSRVKDGTLGPNARRALHPLAWAHPRTGETVLYVNERHLSHVDGMDPAQSEALLDELKTYVRRPDNIYSHKWRVGDLVIWDNLALLHARSAWDPAEPRTLRRAQCGW